MGKYKRKLKSERKRRKEEGRERYGRKEGREARETSAPPHGPPAQG